MSKWQLFGTIGVLHDLQKKKKKVAWWSEWGWRNSLSLSKGPGYRFVIVHCPFVINLRERLLPQQGVCLYTWAVFSSVSIYRSFTTILTLKYSGQMQHLKFRGSNNTDYPVTKIYHIYAPQLNVVQWRTRFLHVTPKVCSQWPFEWLAHCCLHNLKLTVTTAEGGGGRGERVCSGKMWERGKDG